MHENRFDSKACPESPDELWSQADFGNEHQDLATAIDDVADQVQVYLRLAATGHTVEETYPEATA